jgi:hypothetical protein
MTNISGFLYVIYADGDHLAVLMCQPKSRGQGQKDMTCDPKVSTQHFLLLARQGVTSLPVNSTLVETVKVLAADSCVDYLFLGEPTLGVCRFD